MYEIRCVFKYHILYFIYLDFRLLNIYVIQMETNITSHIYFKYKNYYRKHEWLSHKNNT